jgi:hypothetical protein
MGVGKYRGLLVMTIEGTLSEQEAPQYFNSFQLNH